MDIAGKTVLITGASSGLGMAIAEAISFAGAAKILLLARNANALDLVANKINRAGCQAFPYVVDLSDPVALDALSKVILQEVGVPDVIVNNAGAGQWKFLEETTFQELKDMMAVPYFAAAWITKAFLPAMKSRKHGHLVFVSSVASRFVWPGATGYIAARWAVRGLAEALRSDLYHSGIEVSLYESAEIETPYWLNNPGSRERVPRIGKLIPVLTPQEAAKAIVNGIQKNSKLIVTPLMTKLIYIQHFLFPWLVQWLMTVTGYHREK